MTVRLSSAKVALILACVLLVGMVSAGVNPMLALYLLRKADATPLQLSSILAVFNVSGMVAGLGLGALADRRGALRQAYALTGVTACVAYTVLALSPPLWAVAIVLVVLGGPALAAGSLMFALLRAAGLTEPQMMYARASFSLSWILGPAAGAFLVEGLGFGALFGVTAAMSVISMAAMLAVVPRPVAPAAGRAETGAEAADGRVGVIIWVVAAMIGVFICLKAVNSATVSFLPILTGEIWGIDLTLAGTALGLCAACEVGVLALLGRFRNFGLGRPTVIGIGAVCGMVYVVGLIAWPTVGALLVLQVFNAVFIATMSGAGMMWFQDLSGSRPGLMTAIYMNTARLGAIVAAPVLGLGGVGPLVACAALVAVGGLGIAVIAWRTRAAG